MIAEMCRDFAERNISPKMMEWDESQEFPVPLFKEMGKLGLMGIIVPEQYGGAHAPPMPYYVSDENYY